MNDKVVCPQCRGFGRINAMSGAHLPHQMTCTLCNGYYGVTIAEADNYLKGVAKYDKQLRESLKTVKN